MSAWMPSTTKGSPAPRGSSTGSAPCGRTTPAAPPTPVWRLTRTSPTCTASTGTTVGPCQRSASATSSRTCVSMSAPPTWGPGLTRRISAGGRSGSCMYHCVGRTASSGGRTARTPSPARSTGIRAGTGPQAPTSVPRAPCARSSSTSSPSRPHSARRSGPIPTTTAPTTAAAAAASRCGSTLCRGTPTWPWRSTMPMSLLPAPRPHSQCCCFCCCPPSCACSEQGELQAGAGSGWPQGCPACAVPPQGTPACCCHPQLACSCGINAPAPLSVGVPWGWG